MLIKKYTVLAVRHQQWSRSALVKAVVRRCRFIDDLLTIKPVNTTVHKFSDYLLETCVEQDALFPPNRYLD